MYRESEGQRASRFRAIILELMPSLSVETRQPLLQVFKVQTASSCIGASRWPEDELEILLLHLNHR